MSVFFFQAEDGIRDDLVTGVQTCALPILWLVNGVLRLIGVARLMLFGGVFSPGFAGGSARMPGRSGPAGALIRSFQVDSSLWVFSWACLACCIWPWRGDFSSGNPGLGFWAWCWEF